MPFGVGLYFDEESDARRRTKVFGFPQQMAALRGLLDEFVTEVFGSTRFDQRILLRGVEGMCEAAEELCRESEPVVVNDAPRPVARHRHRHTQG